MVTKGTDFSQVFSKSMQPQNYEIVTSFQQNQENQQQQSTTTQTTTGNFNDDQIKTLSQLPFWILDPTEHDNKWKQTYPHRKCCFNHYIGLPKKYGERFALFDFQIHEQYKGQPGIFHALENNNAVYVLKATGIGFSELTLRYMCWKAFTGQAAQYQNSQMVIVTGPNVELATKQITRIRDMFRDRLGVEFSSEKTKLTLPVNNVTIQAYPSHNVSSFRGLPKVSIIFIDEGDFFPIGQQVAVRDASERYLGKSNAKIVLGSTPYSPSGLMETIQKEENSIYYKLFLNYEVGLNKIFTKQDIERARTSPSFEREYNLRYAYDIGDLFLESTIQKCLDIKYDPSVVVYESPKVLGIDPAYGGSSKFAYVLSQYVDGRIQVLTAQEFERPDPQQIEKDVIDLIHEYKLETNGQILVDGANVAFIKYLKRMLNENQRYDEIAQEDYKYMKVRPINFGINHRTLLTNMVSLVSKGYVAIDERFDALLSQMRIAKCDANFSLIKKPLSLDLIDALRLSLYGFELN